MKTFEDKSTDISQVIVALEKKYWTAMRENDLQTAVSLTDFPCLVAGSSGISAVSRAEFEKMFESHKGAIRSFSFDERKAEVRQVGPDTAVIAYEVQATYEPQGKQATNINAVDTSTWIKRGQTWVCAMHTETELNAAYAA